MSAGDLPRYKGPDAKDEYKKALHDPRFQAVLGQGFKVNFDYDIPYLGGYSQDGSTIYIDKDVPAQVKRGKKIYQLRPGMVAGICTHEHWEKTAMRAWKWDYDDAHKLATLAENNYARDVLKMNPNVYESVWDPFLRFTERKLHARNVQLPPDLDKAPYK